MILSYRRLGLDNSGGHLSPVVLAALVFSRSAMRNWCRTVARPFDEASTSRTINVTAVTMYEIT